jgi:hypothetical protein
MFLQLFLVSPSIHVNSPQRTAAMFVERIQKILKVS